MWCILYRTKTKQNKTKNKNKQTDRQTKTSEGLCWKICLVINNDREVFIPKQISTKNSKFYADTHLFSTHAHTHTHTHTHTLTHMHARTHIHTHILTHKYTRARTNAHTHTHTHTHTCTWTMIVRAQDFTKSRTHDSFVIQISMRLHAMCVRKIISLISDLYLFVNVFFILYYSIFPLIYTHLSLVWIKLLDGYLQCVSSIERINE